MRDYVLIARGSVHSERRGKKIREIRERLTSKTKHNRFIYTDELQAPTNTQKVCIFLEE